MKKAILFCLLFPVLVFAQKSHQVVSKSGEGVPYATLFFDNKYGYVTDSLGFFDSKPGTQTIRITAIGFEEANLNVKALPQKITLTEVKYALNEVKIKPKKLNYTSFGQSSLIKAVFYPYGDINFEIGEVIKNPKHIEGVIEEVKVRVGFEGEGGANFRIVIYDFDEKGLPRKNLMKEDVVFHVTGDLKNYKFDIGKQMIEFPKEGILLGLEVLNPEKVKFKTGFHPAFGFHPFKKGENFARSETRGNWAKNISGDQVFCFSLKVGH